MWILPPVFNFPYRPEVIKKVYVNLDSHHYQKQGRYPAAGEIVSAESRNTGLGIARLAESKRRRFFACRTSSWGSRSKKREIGTST